MTLRSYIEKLKKLGEDYPQTLDFMVVYDADEAGKVYQLYASPSLCKVESDDYTPFDDSFTLLGVFYDENLSNTKVDNCNAVCIN